MSLETWIAEFYPVNAASAEAQASDLSAAQHSLRKWEGVSKVNLKKHKVIQFEDSVCADFPQDDYSEFILDSDSCALCEKFYDECYDEFFDEFYEDCDPCKRCPLFKTLGAPCDYVGGIYDQAINGDPWPMIRALRKTVKRLEKAKYPEAE